MVVVGAGFAGLTAALAVRRGGHSVAVLEARSRVGGRVAGHRLPSGEFSERGGTFVGPTQDRILAALDRFGIGTFPTYDEGYERLRQRRPADGVQRHRLHRERATRSADPPGADHRRHPPRPDVDLGPGRRAVEGGERRRVGRRDARRLDRGELGDRAVPPPRPGRDAADLRSRPGRALAALRPLLHRRLGERVEPGELRAQLQHPRRRPGARIEGGSQVLGQAMAAALGKRRIVKRSPVRRIVQRRGRVRVVSDRAVVIAKRAIVAIPPVLAGRIDYQPAMPAARDALTQRLAAGGVDEGRRRLRPKPFWRAAGLNGSTLSTDGLVNATFDDSPEDGRPGRRLRLRRRRQLAALRRPRPGGPPPHGARPSSPSCSAPRRCNPTELLLHPVAGAALEPRRAGRHLPGPA